MVVPNVVSAEEAQALLHEAEEGNHLRQEISQPPAACSPLVRTVFNRILIGSGWPCEVQWEAPSYARFELQPRGHEPHYDGYKEDGTHHMPWCGMSVSVLLSHPDDFEGGIFRTHGESRLDTSPIRHYRSAVVYGSSPSNPEGYGPVKHSVTPHTGRRVVLLGFFQCLW